MRVTRLVEQHFRFADTGALDAADARRTWSERRTLLLVVTDDAGNVGLGEAAPLPDYSPDSLDDAWNALAPLVGKPLAELGPGASVPLRAASAALSSPSARFAFESAVLDVWSRRRAEPAFELLARMARETAGSADALEAPQPLEALSVAALVPSGKERALEHARRAFARGVRCFKVKLGVPGAWSEELATLESLRETFPGVRLRADANQSFSPTELAERLPALGALELEWLEEPTGTFPSGLEATLAVPIALDESLQGGAPDPMFARERGVRAYVLKPTALGGFGRALELAEGARSAGISIVVSHTYEGAVGFSAAAALALALGPGRPPDGLDRHAGSADAPELPAFDPVSGRIRPWTEPGFGLPLDTLLERREITREARA